MTRKERWLRQCYEQWTKSSVETEAWKYRGDFEGFCRWWLKDVTGWPSSSRPRLEQIENEQAMR